jgi:hypothetical protein
MTPHFSLAELTHTDHREFDNIPNTDEIANLQRLAELLEKVKALLGNKPVMINSAFRCKQVNDAVGSKDTSQHRLGCAADIRIPGVLPDEVVRTVIASGLPYDQIIREFDRWTHISVTSVAGASPRRQALIIDRSGVRAWL